MAIHHGGVVSNGSMIPIGVAAAIIMVLLQAISYIAWTVTNTNLERIEKQSAARSQIIETQFLRVREHEEFTKRIDAQISKMEARLSDVSTRSEVDARLGINSNSIIQVRAEVDALKRDLGQTYSIKDALSAIQGRVDRVEQWSRTPHPQQQPTPPSAR